LGDFSALKFYWFWVSGNFQKSPGGFEGPPGDVWAWHPFLGCFRWIAGRHGCFRQATRTIVWFMWYFLWTLWYF